MSDEFPADLIRPLWGQATLADLLPTVLAQLGVGPARAGGSPPPADRMGLTPTRAFVVLLVDGLGLVDIGRHADAAPYLSSLTSRELTAGCPSTTVTSLTSLGTGLPPGRHGLPGYTTWDPAVDAVVHWLRWHPADTGRDLREELPPEEVQPHPTIWELAEAAGVATTVVNSRWFEGSGLTRAAFRGGRYSGVMAEGDALAAITAAADRGHRSLVYGYLPQLDLMGHVHGPGTEPWRAQLAMVDRFVELLAARLPPQTTLLVTGDHGMMTLDPETVVDADGGDGRDGRDGRWQDGSRLRDGVTAIAGEARMRHVHAVAGAHGDVLATWRGLLGDRAWVVPGEVAIDAGLFGPEVDRPARSRIGDVVAFCRDRAAVVQSRRESRSSAMPGHHGSLTAGELLVPLLVDVH